MWRKIRAWLSRRVYGGCRLWNWTREVRVKLQLEFNKEIRYRFLLCFFVTSPLFSLFPTLSFSYPVHPPSFPPSYPLPLSLALFLTLSISSPLPPPCLWLFLHHSPFALLSLPPPLLSSTLPFHPTFPPSSCLTPRPSLPHHRLLLVDSVLPRGFPGIVPIPDQLHVCPGKGQPSTAEGHHRLPVAALHGGEGARGHPTVLRCPGAAQRAGAPAGSPHGPRTPHQRQGNRRGLMKARMRGRMNKWMSEYVKEWMHEKEPAIEILCDLLIE